MYNGYHKDERLFSDIDLEEEFVTWTHILNYDSGVGGNLRDMDVDNEGYITVEELTGGNVLGIDRTGTVVTNVGIGKSAFQDKTTSHTRKFILEAYNIGVLDIGIFRHGTLIWTRNPLLDNADILAMISAHLSPNARFIVILTTSIASANRRYLDMYEGS